jgi:hypothetical protein
MRKLALLFSIIVLSSGICFAQTSGFTYQGKLGDGGSPANGDYQFECKLFSDVTAGSQIGSTQTVVATVQSGGFTTQLDFGVAAFPAGKDRWLEISVRLNGSSDSYAVLSPRQQVNSVPFAVRSLKATNADNADNATNATTATTATTAGSVTGVVQVSNGGTGSATQNFVDLTSNQTSIGGNKTFTGTLSGTNFNVSSATPTIALKWTDSFTSGSLRFVDGPSGTVDGQLFMTGKNAPTPYLIELLNSFGPITLKTSDANGPIILDTSSVERMRITAAGSVGIGTSNPAGVLDVSSAGAPFQTELRVEWTNATGVGDLAFTENGLPKGRLVMTGSTNPMPYLMGLDNFQNGILEFSTNSIERMRITAAGNVGIGTDTPNAKLQVAGGSVYIAHPSSLIITSPNGACWFITVNDSGALSTISVTCPN